MTQRNTRMSRNERLQYSSPLHTKRKHRYIPCYLRENNLRKYSVLPATFNNIKEKMPEIKEKNAEIFTETIVAENEKEKQTENYKYRKIFFGGSTTMSKSYLAKRDIDNVNLEAIEPERRNQIIAIKNDIQLNYEYTLDYAGDASKNLTAFSSDLLKTMKVKDTPEVEGLITELVSGIEKVDVGTLMERKPSLFRRLFKIDELKTFVAKYEDVADIVDDVKSKLEQANFQLKKDIEVCNRYLEQNLNYINELDNYIMAGKLRAEEERIAIEHERTIIDMDDMLAVHTLNARQNEVDRLERKLHNLLLMRAIAIQNIPQILLIKDGDGVLIEKIDSSIHSAIPLWESQMVIAIQLMRQKGALAVQQSVTDMTNNLIAKNSELLKEGSVAVATELEKGIVDVAVLKKSSENLIATLDSIKKVHDEGAKARILATRELATLQSKLNEQMLLSSANPT